LKDGGVGEENFFQKVFFPHKKSPQQKQKIPSTKKQKTIEKSEKVWYNIVIYYIMM
jgi:cell division protein FtsL